jgi:hypothetical protein
MGFYCKRFCFEETLFDGSSLQVNNRLARAAFDRFVELYKKRKYLLSQFCSSNSRLSFEFAAPVKSQSKILKESSSGTVSLRRICLAETGFPKLRTKMLRHLEIQAELALNGERKNEVNYLLKSVGP